MQLTGHVSPDRPLLVFAAEEEAAHVDRDLPMLITGIGKVNAAAALATVLGQGARPLSVINLGTAGALKHGWSGIHEVATVTQHDLDTEVLRSLTGRTYGEPIALAPAGAVLATGDAFVSDSRTRERLAAAADLVDMEGYAIAAVARMARIPARLIKHVSDSADDSAERTWRDAVDECAKSLASWVADHVR